MNTRFLYQSIFSGVYGAGFTLLFCFMQTLNYTPVIYRSVKNLKNSILKVSDVLNKNSLLEMIIPKKYAILFWIDNSTGLGNLLKKGVFYDINSMIIF